MVSLYVLVPKLAIGLLIIKRADLTFITMNLFGSLRQAEDYVQFCDDIEFDVFLPRLICDKSD